MSPARLAAWLARVPLTASRLELRYEDLRGKQALAAWSRDELSDFGRAADQVLMAAQDYCEDTAQRCRFEAVWLDENGRVVALKGIHCIPTEAEEEDDLLENGAGNPPREERNANGLVAQLMRHVENRERLLNLALATNLKLMSDNARAASAESATLREENRLLRRLLQEQEEQSENAGEIVESEARAEALQKVATAVSEHIVPLIATRLREGML